MKNLFVKAKEAVSSIKTKAVVMATSAVSALTVTALASVESSSPSVVVTEEMLQPVINGVTGNVSVILPVGIIIFGILLGIGFVPKIIKKFAKG